VYILLANPNYIQRILYATYTVCNVHHVQRTLYAAHTVCNAHYMQRTLYATYTVCNVLTVSLQLDGPEAAIFKDRAGQEY